MGSWAESTAFLERLGLIRYLKRVLETKDLALLHPKEELGKPSHLVFQDPNPALMIYDTDALLSVGQLADREKVDYTVTVIKDDEGRNRLSCKVCVGEREVVEVRNGLTRMEVETRAADEACRVLRGEGRRVGKGRKSWRGDEAGADEAGDGEGEVEAGDGDEEGDEDEEDGGLNVEEFSCR